MTCSYQILRLFDNMIFWLSCCYKNTVIFLSSCFCLLSINETYKVISNFVIFYWTPALISWRISLLLFFFSFLFQLCICVYRHFVNIKMIHHFSLLLCLFCKTISRDEQILIETKKKKMKERFLFGNIKYFMYTF